IRRGGATQRGGRGGGRLASYFWDGTLGRGHRAVEHQQLVADGGFEAFDLVLLAGGVPPELPPQHRRHVAGGGETAVVREPAGAPPPHEVVERARPLVIERVLGERRIGRVIRERCRQRRGTCRTGRWAAAPSDPAPWPASST